MCTLHGRFICFLSVSHYLFLLKLLLFILKNCASLRIKKSIKQQCTRARVGGEVVLERSFSLEHIYSFEFFITASVSVVRQKKAHEHKWRQFDGVAKIRTGKITNEIKKLKYLQRNNSRVHTKRSTLEMEMQMHVPHPATT